MVLSFSALTDEELTHLLLDFAHDPEDETLLSILLELLEKLKRDEDSLCKKGGYGGSV